MRGRKFRIGVMAPASRLDPAVPERIVALAQRLYGGEAPDFVFHPQCFLSSGHFAGADSARAQAFLDIANDENFDALWFARGGYGSNRIASGVLSALTIAARNKTYMGYSDTGFLLAGLYRAGFPHIAHGPVIADANREGGEEAVIRGLRYLFERDTASLEPSISSTTPSVAFNMIILSNLIGTALMPDLASHVLMLEETSEYMYSIDRMMFHITAHPPLRKLAGIRIGRCSAIPPNDPPFGQTEEEVVRHWCTVSGIPYLGRADIGHDVANKVVPFGRLPAV
ncbi:MAG: LD-carboxypeptidase [Proteobacteria bacterium]|nr:LD-carboxypeptidase [Pseudomonadota bacterium]